MTKRKATQPPILVFGRRCVMRLALEAANATLLQNVGFFETAELDCLPVWSAVPA